MVMGSNGSISDSKHHEAGGKNVESHLEMAKVAICETGKIDDAEQTVRV